jgi:alkanesulfonate monooxygenase
MNLSEPRFGVWVPVSGNWGPTDYRKEKHDASFERAKRIVLEAERLGFATTLVAQHTINPFGQQFSQLETWTASAALAAITERIEIIAAIKPYLHHPVVLAKMALGIEEISHGRFAINLVNAWYRPELEKSGIGFAEHDTRYQYGNEWLGLVKRLLEGERVTFDGNHFHVTDYNLKPLSQWRRRPFIYSGGESEPARNLAAQLADAWFINGQPLFEVEALIADLKSRLRWGAPLRFGLSAFVIARESDIAAREVLDWFWEEKKKEDWSELYANVDLKAQMFKTAEKYPHIGTNGGTAAGLVGSYDTVARCIREFAEIGVDTFMLQFQPFLEEQERFATEVMPRVQRLFVRAQVASGSG